MHTGSVINDLLDLVYYYADKPQCRHVKWNETGDDLIPCLKMALQYSGFCAEHQGIHEE